MCEEQVTQQKNEEAVMQWKAQFPDPTIPVLFILFKNHGPGVYKPIYKSEVTRQKNNCVFMWNIFSLSIQDMFDNDLEKEVKIEFYEAKESGNHTIIATTCFTLEQLQAKERDFVL